MTKVLDLAPGAAIQTALDGISGGVLRLLPGRHPSGALRLPSDTELHLMAGADLVFAPEYEAYADNEVRVVAEGSTRALITAPGARDVAITGPGRILAPGPAYVTGFDTEVGTHVTARLRPRVLVAEGVKGLRLEGFTVEASPMWTLHLVGCRDVVVKGVTVLNDRRLPNTDGIVIDACQGVRVEDVTIDTADDGVCLKTSAGAGVCRDVVVRRVSVQSQSCALKIGTESHGDISDITFEDCQVRDSNRALGIFSRDGGRIERVRFANIAVDCHETHDGFWGSGEAITITALSRVAARPAGAVRDVVFQGISGRMEGAICLIGRGVEVSDITFSDIALRQEVGALGTAQNADMRPTPADLAVASGAKGRANAWTKDPAGRLLGVEPYPGGLPGLYAEGVTQLRLDGLHIERPEPLPEGWSGQPVDRR